MGHWATVHFRVCGISDESLTGKHGPCPKHGGKDKWRTFDDYEKTGGAVCNECGKMADGYRSGKKEAKNQLNGGRSK